MIYKKSNFLGIMEFRTMKIMKNHRIATPLKDMDPDMDPGTQLNHRLNFPDMVQE